MTFLLVQGKRKLVVDSDEDQPTSKASGRAKRDHGATVEGNVDHVNKRYAHV